MKIDGMIMALDLATTTGWTIGTPGKNPVFGHCRFGRPGDTEGAVRFQCFRWINDFFKLNHPKVLFVEEPVLIQNRGTRRPENPATLKRLWGLSAVVDAVAYGRGIYDFRTVQADAVRRHFIGMTRALPGDKAKALVQERCRQIGWDFDTPDEADALALWAYGCEQVAPGTGYGFQPGLFPVAAGAAKARPLPQERISAKEAAEKYFKRGKK